MKIWNTTTNELEDIIYAPTGCDCIGDILDSDECIAWNDDEERFEAEESAIAFWREWIEESEKADELEEELAEKLGDKNAAWEVSNDACDGVETNDQPQARIKALTAALKA